MTGMNQRRQFLHNRISSSLNSDRTVPRDSRKTSVCICVCEFEWESVCVCVSMCVFICQTECQHTYQCGPCVPVVTLSIRPSELGLLACPFVIQFTNMQICPYSYYRTTACRYTLRIKESKHIKGLIRHQVEPLCRFHVIIFSSLIGLQLKVHRVALWPHASQELNIKIVASQANHLSQVA